MMTNKCHTSGRHPDSRRQTNSNSDLKPRTGNQYDALTSELFDDCNTFHQPGTVDEVEPTNQQLTGTTEATNTTRTDSVGFHSRTGCSIVFDFHCKNKDKKRYSAKSRKLSRTKQLDKKHKMLYMYDTRHQFNMYEIKTLLDIGAVRNTSA